MPMAKITPVGEAGLYHVHFLDRTDPGFGGGGGGGGVDPGYDRPIHHPGHPDHGLPSRPGFERPDQGLPGGRPPHVGNRPPGSGGGGIPDNELPEAPPPTLLPGWTLAMVRTHDGKWHYASVPPNTAPPKPLPEPTPPGGAPDQGLPPTPAHPIAGAPAPAPAPTHR